MPRCYMTLQNEPLHLEKGSEPAQKISYRCFLGGRAYIKPNMFGSRYTTANCFTRMGNRPFASDSVVHFMGESISDGTLANFMKMTAYWNHAFDFCGIMRVEMKGDYRVVICWMRDAL